MVHSNPELAKELRQLQNDTELKELNSLLNEVISIHGEDKFDALVWRLWSVFDAELLRELLADASLIDNEEWIKRQCKRLSDGDILFPQ